MASKIVNNIKRYFRFVYHSSVDNQYYQVHYTSDKFPSDNEVKEQVKKVRSLSYNILHLTCMSVFEFKNKQDFDSFEGK